MTRPRHEWPIVVGGCHRSGTSLVRRILDAHPRIHCGPETPFFRDFHGDYRNDPYGHLRFAASTRSIVSEDVALTVLGGAFVELHERAAREAGKPRWADKAPENVLYTDGWQALLGDEWLFVHVARNPLDCVASMRGRFPRTLPGSAGDLAVWYRRYVEAGQAFTETHPDRSCTVVYERLCTEPEKTIEELMTVLGEGPDPGQLAFNESPHQEGLEDPAVAHTDGVHTTSIGRWREILSPEEVQVVLALTTALWRTIDPSAGYTVPSK